MNRYFVLYIVGGCSFCTDALKLLGEKKEEYIIHDVSHSDKQINEAKEKHKWDTFPIILVSEAGKTKLIGGFDDLKALYGLED
jgi:glutaredoxin